MKNIDLIFAKGSWLEDYIRFMNRRKSVKEQRTFVWCPICHEDLCSNGSFRFDKKCVMYECNNCGCRSAWDFDSIAPILLRHDKLDYSINYADLYEK